MRKKNIFICGLSFFMSVESIAQFMGGIGDGQYSLKANLQPLGVSIFAGGKGDGNYSLLALSQPLGISIYHGGSGEGEISSNSAFQQLGIQIFHGGNGDGEISSNSSFKQLGTLMFQGGVSSGYTASAIDFGAQILSIQLLSFTGKWTGENILLNWSTATETNNQYFELQRLSDSQNFQTIGSLVGAGTSSIINHYVFLDTGVKDQEASLFYYRLKQVDNNGASSFSATILLERTGKGIAISMFPNPATENIHIHIEGVDFINYSLYVFDEFGALVKNRIISANEVVDIKDLAAGNYYFSIYDNSILLKNLKINIQK